MTKTIGNNTYAEILSQVEQAGRQEAFQPTETCKTTRGWASAWNVSESTAERHCRDAVAGGLMRAVPVKVARSNKALMPSTAYEWIGRT